LGNRRVDSRGCACRRGFNAYFSWRGSQELRHEAERLRRQTELLMRGLEEAAKAGNFEWNRNEQGEIIGIAFKR
jgi:glutamate-1-semialdehyde aminotransferase